MPSLPVHVVFCILCTFLSTSSFINGRSPVYLRILSVYLFFTLGVEITSWRLMQSGQQNLKLYNFYSVVNIPFFIYLLKGFLASKKMQRVLVVAMIVYPILALINILFIQGPNIFNTNTYIPGCIILGLISIFYFKENIKSPKQQSLLNDPAFWITTAVLFFYTCTIPVYGLLNFLRNLPDYLYNSIYIFHTVLNVLLYLLFSISFLCNLSFRKSISQ